MSQQPTTQASARGSCARHWMFTVNNPVNAEETISALKQKAQYLVFQLEKAPTTGTLHHQGYVSFPGRGLRLNQLKQLLPTAHWENRRGSHSQAKAYCTKADTRADGDSGPWEWGDDSGMSEKSGSRSDLLEIKAKLDSGAPTTQIWEEHFASSVRYHKAFSTYQAIRYTGRTTPPRVYILYGASGSGKTLLANKLAPNAYWLPKPGRDGQLWFTGYTPGQNIIIDEYYGWIDFDTILRMLDRQPWQAKVHGGTVHFDAPVIVFTTNVRPDQWYSKMSQTRMPAFVRRIAEFGSIHYYPDQFHYRAGSNECPELNLPQDINDFWPSNFSFQLAEPALAGEEPPISLRDSNASADRHAEREGNEAEAEIPCDPNGSPIYYEPEEDAQPSQSQEVEWGFYLANQ